MNVPEVKDGLKPRQSTHVSGALQILIKVTHNAVIYMEVRQTRRCGELELLDGRVALRLVGTLNVKPGRLRSRAPGHTAALGCLRTHRYVSCQSRNNMDVADSNGRKD